MVVADAEAVVAPAITLRVGGSVRRRRRHRLFLALTDDSMSPDVLLEQVFEVSDALEEFLLDYLRRFRRASVQRVARLAQEEAVRHPQTTAYTGVARRSIAWTTDLSLAARLATDRQPLVRVCRAAHGDGKPG